MGGLVDATELVGAYDWYSPENRERAYGEGPRRDGDERPDLVRDRDRVIHSTGLRVLQGKTQIFASRWADPMRTRLTHTLEVMQIGRGIARRIELPEELVEAVCLAHDIGHPPFGHVGERALAKAMKEFGGFDANAQNIRLLADLEEIHPERPGLNLTRATLQSLIKYPFIRTPQSEKDFLYEETLTEYLEQRGTTFGAWLFAGSDGLPLAPGDRPGEPPPRTLACQVMDWADDAAYSVHDLEDGVYAKFIETEAIKSDAFAETILKDIEARLASSRPKQRTEPEISFDSVAATLHDLYADIHQARMTSERVALRRATRSYLNDFIVDLAVERPFPEKGAYGYELVVPPQHRLRAEVLKSVVIEFVLKDERIARYLFKGRRMLSEVFNELLHNPGIIDDSPHQLLPRAVRKQLDGSNAADAVARAACDYLAGLTENQLTLLYQTMFESTGGSPLR